VRDSRLFVDIQTIQSLRAADRGIPRFATELCRALIADGAPVAAFALNPLVPWPERIHPELARARQLTWNTATAFRRALAAGPLCYIVVSPFELSRPVQAVLGAHIVGVPRVAIVHDLIPHIFPGLFDLDDTALGRVYERRLDTIRSFDLVLTPSESTRRDVIEHLGIASDRVSVIGEAASPFFVPAGSGDDPTRLVRQWLPAITRPFVLCVSGWEGHKNTESLIEAWARLGPPVRDEYQLVVVCSLPEEARRAWTNLAEHQGIRPDEIVMSGFVEDDLLRALYQSAALFVLPSRYEGFGLPVLEAINCACATISSNTSSLPELVGWPAGTFSPDDPNEIAHLIERALTDATYRAELDLRCSQAAGRHSWPRVVERVLAACAGMRDHPYRRPRRPRIALVGPLPPTPTWIAGYNAQLADRLARHCDVDCFTEPFNAAGRRASRAYRTFPVAALGPTLPPASYDAVLYTVGTEPDETYRLALTYPGVVWLHDLTLADNELIAQARGVILDSEDARALLEQKIDPDDSTTPTWVIPSAASDAVANRPTRDDERPVAFDEVALRVIEIAGLDLEPARPLEAPPPVSASASPRGAPGV
jgi:glycosyltransferase involved in cell wall biosynthesis